MILIDSNVPMYLVGRSDTHRYAAESALTRLVAAGERLVSDAEVMQEIVHRYTSIRCRDAIRPALDALLGVVDEVLSIDGVDVEAAAALVEADETLGARDALHLAVMKRHGISRILSFDGDFDGRQGIQRLH